MLKFSVVESGRRSFNIVECGCRSFNVVAVFVSNGNNAEPCVVDLKVLSLKFQMLPDLKEQWTALFLFPDGVGEVVAVLRNIYSILDWLAGQSEGSRALWVSLLASLVTIA